MQRFALSLALVAMLGFGFAGSVTAADEATDTGAPKETTKHKSCTKKSKACHKGSKKAHKTESTETTTTETTK
jgi:hypothetical protein